MSITNYSIKRMIEIVLPQHLKNEDEKEVVASFKKISQHTLQVSSLTEKICIRTEKNPRQSHIDALTKICLNILTMSRPLKKAISKLSKNAIDDLDATYSGLCGTNLYDVFTVDYFNFLLPQSGITEYNKIIGGYTTSDGTKS